MTSKHSVKVSKSSDSLSPKTFTKRCSKFSKINENKIVLEEMDDDAEEELELESEAEADLEDFDQKDITVSNMPGVTISVQSVKKKIVQAVKSTKNTDDNEPRDYSNIKIVLSGMDEYESIYAKKNNEHYMNARYVLKNKFGHDKFKPYQYKIIDNIVNGTDVVAVMPTGYGKSLCFQLPPLLTKKIAIVISPLIALMADQKMILDKLGMSSCCYNSLLGVKKKREVERGLELGLYQVMYTTPEMLSTSRDLINKIYTKQGICMVAIDEAHCLSSYGFDFRPKYRELVLIRKLMPKVPVLAVTATATDKVVDDIVTVMKMTDCETIKTSFDRPNLKIHVSMYSQHSFDQIVENIQGSTGSSIIYCVTKADTEEIAEKLRDEGVEAKAYHAGLKKEDRTKIQEEFMNNTYRCIVATMAFGMGINKPDIRIVVHYGCPQNIESYYQEIGRAGRDGNESSCYLYYRPKDFIIQQKLIETINNPSYKLVRTKLLQIMSSYINNGGCRRRFILEYFGEENTQAKCTACDNCTNVKKKVNKRDEHEMYQIIATISEIESIKDYSFGASTITLILKGSSSKKIQPWMKELMYYGCMKNENEKKIKELLYKGVELGYLEDHDIGKCVRVLKCTDRGAMFGEKYENKLEEDVNKKDYKTAKLILD